MKNDVINDREKSEGQQHVPYIFVEKKLFASLIRVVSLVTLQLSLPAKKIAHFLHQIETKANSAVIMQIQTPSHWTSFIYMQD